MKQGAFAFLDCLGFKGVWNRGVVGEQIVQFLEQAKANANKNPLVHLVRESFPAVDQSIIFVSDTVALSFCLPAKVARPDLAAGYLTSLAAYLTIELAVEFASAPVPLLFRGTIVYGEHIARDSFMLGRAVDEAADVAESAQGAFVWIHPHAQRHSRAWQNFRIEYQLSQINQLTPDQRIQYVDSAFAGLLKYSPTLRTEEMERIVTWWNRLDLAHKQQISALVLRECWRPSREDGIVHDYPVPMKQGGDLRVDTVNPHYRIEPARHSLWIQRVLDSFGASTVDVMLKKQNTARFLEFASKVTADAVAQTRASVVRAQEEAAKITGVPFQ